MLNTVWRSSYANLYLVEFRDFPSHWIYFFLKNISLLSSILPLAYVLSLFTMFIGINPLNYYQRLSLIKLYWQTSEICTDGPLATNIILLFTLTTT